MNEDKRSVETEPFDDGEADAVCEQCGTVNPLGAVLCRECGNNLREQRQRRIAAGRVAQAEDRPSPRRYVAGILAVLGVLLCLVTVLNLEGIVASIAQRMTTAEATVEAHPEQFWIGPRAEAFNQLAMRLSDNPVRSYEIQSGGGGVAGGYEGRYFIMDANGGRRAPVLGYANVARDGETYHLVAQFGEVEVRAELMVMGGNVVAREAGARVRDTFIPAYGYGNAQPDGTLLCSGQTGTSNRFYQVVAHRVP